MLVETGRLARIASLSVKELYKVRNYTNLILNQILNQDSISIGSLSRANDAKPQDKIRIQTTLVDLTVDEEGGGHVAPPNISRTNISCIVFTILL